MAPEPQPRYSGTPAQQLATFAAEIDARKLPAAVIADLKDRIFDVMVLCIAGAESEVGIAMRRVVAESGGFPQAAVAGESERMPALSAALVNGTYAHALDFDDTHLPALVHPSASLVPAVLAQAQALSSSGTEALEALAAGYEVGLRISMGQYDAQTRKSTFFEHGFHATSIVGTIAGAVACAKLRGLEAAGILNALGVACSMGSGIEEANRMGGSVKSTHCGWAAHGAVAAATMAACGITAPVTVLEGRFGFFEAYLQGTAWNAEALTDRLGERWLGPETYFKPYPCNGFCHAIADAGLRLRKRNLDPDSIARVTIATSASSLRSIGQPIEQKRRPQTPYHAKFSAPYIFAAGLLGENDHGIGFEAFSEEAFLDPRRRALMERCDVVADPECSALYPEALPAIVTLELRDGSRIVERVMDNLGSPARPLSREWLFAKGVMCAGETRATQLRAALDTIETSPTVEPLFDALVLDKVPLG